MEILGLHEVILYVQDMDRMVKFYRDLIGLKISFPGDQDSYAQEHWVTFETGTCSLALHAGGKGRKGEDTPKIVFKVPKIQQARQELVEKGISMFAIRPAAQHVWVCDGFDPEKNPIAIESIEILAHD